MGMKLSPDMEAKVLALAAGQLPPAVVHVGGWAVGWEVPGLRVVSEANERCHWAVRHRRFKAQAERVRLSCAAFAWVPLLAKRDIKAGGVVAVTLTRLGGRRLDTDNLSGAFKGCRDELARWLGVDDGHPGWRWGYAQRPGGPVGVRVDFVGQGG